MTNEQRNRMAMRFAARARAAAPGTLEKELCTRIVLALSYGAGVSICNSVAGVTRDRYKRNAMRIERLAAT